ncbi:hypothetical protein BB560_000774 [Smittium megazygosporum]|uniref:malate dehydrogenase n=1 Tax=Smittium megazygosporum TaxID=133381 RepID=A0A2T9ZJE8_9FUNG|nr:hypothetical protein BB560_000774 [Smittium megazygosporum]
MFKFTTASKNLLVRSFSSSVSAQGAKVAVLGAAGGIGQPLSMLLKLNPLVGDLNLYDIANAPGVASDLSHINTSSTVRGFSTEEQGLSKALEGRDVVVIPAGVPRKPGMTRDDLFGMNAKIAMDLSIACAEVCPKASILIISNPVNSLLPLAAQVFKNKGVFDPKKMIGITTLDLVRASRFAFEKTGKVQFIPVIGGHAGTTIVPLYSQCSSLKLSPEDLAALVHRTQFGGDEVVQAKAGKGSATLSMAYAGARLVDSVVRASQGEDVVECGFVANDTYASEGVDYFAGILRLGKEGVSEILPLPENITQLEKDAIKAALPQLASAAKKGIDFVTNN